LSPPLQFDIRYFLLPFVRFIHQVCGEVDAVGESLGNTLGCPPEVQPGLQCAYSHSVSSSKQNQGENILRPTYSDQLINVRLYVAVTQKTRWPLMAPLF